jgi:deoxyhypusine synthase
MTKLPKDIINLINDYYVGDRRYNQVILEIENIKELLDYILKEDEYDYRIDDGILLFQNAFKSLQLTHYSRKRKWTDGRDGRYFKNQSLM